MAIEEGTLDNNETPVSTGGEVDLLDGIPEEALRGDPELQEMIEEEKKSSKDVKDKGIDGDKGGDDKNSAADDTDSVSEVKDGDSIPGDEKNPDQGEESIENIDFADDVIAGLKGEHLKKLPKEALEALAAYVEKHTSVSGEASKASESLNKLLADPIVKKRLDLLNKGKTDYETRGISDGEKQAILKAIEEKAGLDSSEAEAAYNAIKDNLDSIVKGSAKDSLQNLILEDDGQRQQEEVGKKGRAAFLELKKFNKDLEFKETDPSKFWVKGRDGVNIVNDAHPEAAKFKEKVLPVMNSFAKCNLSYSEMIKIKEEFGEEAIYALSAIKLGLPVAFNTGERDKKIVASELRKRLAPFIKSNGSGELAVNGGSKIAETRSKAVIKSGYDVKRLASDPEYYEKALIAKTTSAHMDLIEALAEEGEALIAKEQKPIKK